MLSNSDEFDKIWNEEALKTLQSKHFDWFSNFQGASFRKATEIGLRHVNSDTINLLKTDLWNEGIQPKADILGRYQHYEKFTLHGMDISQIVCSHAKSRIKNIHIIQGDIRNLPFRNHSFDIILDLSTLDHISKNQVRDVIQEYERTLSKGGILVLIFLYTSFSAKLKFKIKGFENPLQNYFSVNSVKNELKKEFYFLGEYGIGNILCIPFLGRFLNRLPTGTRNLILNLLLNFEYSKVLRPLLKKFGVFYCIIARKE